jgi:hypothetical protein
MVDKHTPGPWVGSEDGRLFSGSGNFLVFDANSEHIVAEIPVPIHDVPIPRAQSEANARLIAAAPELLDALREVMSPGHDCERLGGGDKESCPVCARAHAAIKKATRV